MNEDTLKEIMKLQDNLQTIRKVAGWTTEELGERIGVTKQTISNLENKNTRMTKTQYIALRAILDYEVVTNPDSVALARVIDVLLNEEETNDTQVLDEKAELDKSTLSWKLDKFDRNMTTLAATPLAIVASALNPITMVATMGWLAKIINDNKKK